MTILLDADSSQLRFRLRQAVKYLKAQQTAVDFPQLLYDLLWWGNEEHSVQRRWARAYFTENQSRSNE
jgi:CRISPR type I-E-associated protein CasB/Cse2